MFKFQTVTNDTFVSWCYCGIITPKFISGGKRSGGSPLPSLAQSETPGLLLSGSKTGAQLNSHMLQRGSLSPTHLDLTLSFLNTTLPLFML